MTIIKFFVKLQIVRSIIITTQEIPLKAPKKSLGTSYETCKERKRERERERKRERGGGGE